MRIGTLSAAVLIVLAACEPQARDDRAAPEIDIAADSAPQPSASAAAAPLRWVTAGGSEGAHAHLLTSDGTMVLSLGCRLGSGELEVVVPGLTRVGSEDRLSLGFNDDPIALAVDMAAEGGGVRARGAVPGDIADRIMSATAVGLSYGNQNLGPYQPPTSDEARSLATACAPAADRSEP